MRKDKVFELRIEEDDDLSGIDSISLVDEPAIEINWVAFNKEKSHEFHIPDGEDDNYLEQLAPYGQSEEELLEDGFEIHSIEYEPKQDFTYSYPNAKSEIDTDNFRVRYKYVLNPKAGGSPVIPTTRNFCKTLINKNLVFRLEDMFAQRNDFGQSFADWRGGYNCRHLFAKIVYKKKGYIPNNAKGKDTVSYDILGYEQNDTRTKNPSFSSEKFSGKVLPISINKTQVFEHGQDENNYNNKESGIKDTNLTENGVKYAKNLGKYLAETGHKRVISSGVKRAKDTANIAKNEANTKKDGENRLVHYINNHLNTWNIGKFDGDELNNFDEQYFVANPHINVPEGVSFNHFKDQMIKCYKYVKNLPESDAIITHSKVIRALNALHHTNGEWNDETTHHFLSSKKQPASDYHFGGKISFDYDGTLTTLEGRLKAKQLVDNGYDVYIVTSRGKGESAPVYKMADKLGIPHDCVYFTNGKPKSEILKKLGVQKHYDNNPEVLKEIEKNAPNIEAEHFDYNVGSIGGYVDPGITKKHNKNFATDVDKQIVLGPAMVPNQKIFRKDNQGNPYYVFFSPETIKMIADKYMKNKFIDNNDLQHNGRAVPDVFVIESWIKESKNDKSTDYGFEHLPVGTWFVSMKINNPEVWKMVKSHELNGFSVSGYFEEVADFMKEKAFLSQVVKILKDVED